MNLKIAALAGTLFMAACATTDKAPVPPVPSAEDMVPPPPMPAALPDPYDLAMKTVDDLLAAGNEQTAIDRVVQLLGNPKISDQNKAEALMRLGDMRNGPGNDLFGAIDAWSELIDLYPDSGLIDEAMEKRDTARGEATSLTFLVENGRLSPTEEFEARFRMGQHQDAADLMLARNLTPKNSYLIDMYQIGYLCDDPDLTGPSYRATDTDGTERVLRFCEFGK
ncbi:MAG: hypothetical protein AAGF20_10965 [Pseudomonadota bacterium]